MKVNIPYQWTMLSNGMYMPVTRAPFVAFKNIVLAAISIAAKLKRHSASDI